MRSPLEFGAFVELDEVGSTQDYLARLVRSGGPEVPGVVLALHQTAGRGRRSRIWLSSKGDSLTMSMAMLGQAQSSQPWLVGMAVAVCAAESLDLRVQWPNDICWNGKKVGGILTEIVGSISGASIPVVGVGINLNQTNFPDEIDGTASSLRQRDGVRRDVRKVAEQILEVVSGFPEPSNWWAISERWLAVDDTPGKRYTGVDGREIVAIELGENGCLIGECEGKRVEILAAEALR